jgi:hypothetical protein
MHPRSLITNMKFTYADKHRELQGKIKYFAYRNDKTGESHVRQFDDDGRRLPRWTDGGLGSHHWDIFANCQQLATRDLRRDVGARLMVIAPEVHLMAAIPEARRVDVLRELTSDTVEAWFERMDLPTAEHAFVIHDSRPSDERPDGHDKDEAHLSEHYLHSHVVLAATVAGLGERETYGVYREQIQQLHEVGRDAMARIWERELGAERVAELDAELAERAERYQRLDAEREQALAHEDDVALGIDTDIANAGLEMA